MAPGGGLLCTSLPYCVVSDDTLVAWNQPSWEYTTWRTYPTNWGLLLGEIRLLHVYLHTTEYDLTASLSPGFIPA